jgi:hypothetical protein
MKLNEKDKRAIKLGVVAAAAVIVFLVGSTWLERWKNARAEGSILKSKLETIDVDEAKQKGLMAIVPAFEMPLGEEEQGFLFRDEFNNQLKKAGIKNDPLKIQVKTRSPLTGYKSLFLVCTAKCRFSQALDLLARLNENPYLVGIEEFKVKIDPKKRSEVELNLTVSTFTKIPKRASRS